MYDANCESNVELNALKELDVDVKVSVGLTKTGAEVGSRRDVEDEESGKSLFADEDWLELVQHEPSSPEEEHPSVCEHDGELQLLFATACCGGARSSAPEYLRPVRLATVRGTAQLQIPVLSQSQPLCCFGALVSFPLRRFGASDSSGVHIQRT